MRGMFAIRRGSLSAPVLKHGKFVLSFYSILKMCACRYWCEGISDTTALTIEGKGTAALSGEGTAVAGKRSVRSTLQSCCLDD
jgi:hypothetical protein